MPYLEMPYTDRTGTLHPAACVVIRSVLLRYEPPQNSAEIAVSIYHDVTAQQSGKAAVEERPPTAMTPAEIQAYIDAFGQVAYGVLMGRAEFSSAQVVQP